LKVSDAVATEGSRPLYEVTPALGPQILLFDSREEVLAEAAESFGLHCEPDLRTSLRALAWPPFIGALEEKLEKFLTETCEVVAASTAPGPPTLRPTWAEVKAAVPPIRHEWIENAEVLDRAAYSPADGPEPAAFVRDDTLPALRWLGVGLDPQGPSGSPLLECLERRLQALEARRAGRPSSPIRWTIRSGRMQLGCQDDRPAAHLGLRVLDACWEWLWRWDLLPFAVPALDGEIEVAGVRYLRLPEPRLPDGASGPTPIDLRVRRINAICVAALTETLRAVLEIEKPVRKGGRTRGRQTISAG
jgi:hypothetical protein